MTLSTDDITAIVFYREQKSLATLKEAEEMIDSSHWNLAIQRMYYAAFYMASALLQKNNISTRSHNGVVSQLGYNFVTTGKLSKEDGRLYSRLLQNRITGDYNDFFDFTEEDAKELIGPTKELIAHIKALIDLQHSTALSHYHVVAIAKGESKPKEVQVAAFYGQMGKPITASKLVKINLMKGSKGEVRLA